MYMKNGLGGGGLYGRNIIKEIRVDSKRKWYKKVESRWHGRVVWNMEWKWQGYGFETGTPRQDITQHLPTPNLEGGNRDLHGKMPK